MTIPSLYHPLSSQSQRVTGFEVPGDENLRRNLLEIHASATDLDNTIWAAYRQVFNEQQIIKAHRQLALESQLRHGQLTVRDFVRGLLLSDSFRRLNYDANNNYRFVEMCLQRVLGRSAYNQQEILSRSIVLATQGIEGFIDTLLTSEEYEESFGDSCVPYQRRRILPQRAQGELPIARMARYSQERRDWLYRSGQLRKFDGGVVDRSAQAYRQVLYFLPAASVAALFLVFLFVTL